MGIDIAGLIRGFKLRNYTPPKSEPHPLARKPKPRADIELPGTNRIWRGIVWHHSDSEDGDKEDWKFIKKYHTSYRIDGRIFNRKDFYKRKKAGKGKKFITPWSGIAYHGGIERINGDLKFRLGRSWDKSGAHAGHPGNARFNKYYLGLCAVGDFDEAAPDADRWELALAITRTIMDRFGFWPKDVLGHRETYDLVGRPRAKECPGKKWDMNFFRDQLL